MKEELRNLVEKIKERTGKTQEDIAIEMGYKKNYISEILSPKGNVSGKFLTAIKLRFSEDLKVNYKEVQDSLPTVNEDPALYKALPLGNLVVTLKDYVTLLIETKNKAEEMERRLLALLEKDVKSIKSNSETIQADLEQVARMVRADDMEIMEGTDKTLGREAGTTALRAGIVERAFSESDKEIHTTDSTGKSDSLGKGRKQRKA